MTDRLFIYLLRYTQPASVRVHPLGDGFVVTPVSRPDHRTQRDLDFEDKWRDGHHGQRVYRRRAAYRRHRDPNVPVLVTKADRGQDPQDPYHAFEKDYVYRGLLNPLARRMKARIVEPDDDELEQY